MRRSFFSPVDDDTSVDLYSLLERDFLVSMFVIFHPLKMYLRIVGSVDSPSRLVDVQASVRRHASVACGVKYRRVYVDD